MVLLLESVHDLRLELNRWGSGTESVRLMVTVLQVIRIMWQHSDVMATSQQLHIRASKGLQCKVKADISAVM